MVRRGLLPQIYSDNKTNLVGAEEILPNRLKSVTIVKMTKFSFGGKSNKISTSLLQATWIKHRSAWYGLLAAMLYL